MIVMKFKEANITAIDPKSKQILKNAKSTVMKNVEVDLNKPMDEFAEKLVINFKKRNANIELTGDIYAIIQGGAVKFNPRLQQEQILTKQEDNGKAKKYFNGVELKDNDEIIVYLEAQPEQKTMQKANLGR